MSYIGRQLNNLSDRVKLDSITASATATYNLLLNSVAHVPSSAESLTVSLNGVIQAPQSSYTVSGSQITFASALTSSDSIDFILAERSITFQTPSAGSVGLTQLSATGTKDSTTFLRGDNTFATAGTTINNNADNRVITGSGTANTLEGEANLTFDGTQLSVLDTNAGTDNLLVKTTGDNQISMAVEKSDLKFDIGLDHNNDGSQNFFIRERHQGGSNTNAVRMMIDSSGNIGIGETSPSTKLHVKTSDVGTLPSLQADADDVLIENSTPGITLMGATNGGGMLAFGNTADADAGRIFYYHVNDSMSFYTGGSERMRINDQGSFMVGATSTIGSQGILLKHSDYTASYRTTSDGGHYIHSFHSNVGGTASAKYAIYANGTASTPSDENYKKNITDARNYLEDLEKIKVIKYNWKTDDDSTPKELGFSAQQVETVFAGMVDDDTTPLKNLYEEGDIIPEGKKIGDVKSETPRTQKLLKKEVFIPMLVKSVQELSEKNKTLETKIETLEARVQALENA